MFCHFLFVDRGCQIAQCRIIDALAVVESDDVVGDVGFGLGVIDVLTLADPFHLEVQEEAFSDGVVPAVTLAAQVLRFLVVMLFPQMVDFPPIEVSGQIKPLHQWSSGCSNAACGGIRSNWKPAPPDSSPADESV